MVSPVININPVKRWLETRLGCINLNPKTLWEHYLQRAPIIQKATDTLESQPPRQMSNALVALTHQHEY